MARFIHIVGDQGVGKSILAELISTGLQAQGKRCAIVDSDLRPCTSRAALLAQAPTPGTDVFLVEHDGRDTAGDWLRADDQVIRLSLVAP